MSRDFPDWINPWTAADGRRIFRGSLPLAWMPRLSALLAGEAPGDEVRFTAKFSLARWGDASRRPVIDLEVEAELPLVCQASLQRYQQPVARRVCLGVVATEAEEKTLPTHCEPVRVENGRLALLTLVEDELLLGMPQIPRKPGLEQVAWQSEQTADPAPVGQKQEVAAQGRGDRRKPFADLGRLMRGDGPAQDAD